MSRALISPIASAVASLSALLLLGAAAVPETPPPSGIRNNTPAIHVIRGATVITEPGKTVTDAVIVIRDGIITAVGPAASIDVPKDARTWDATGKYIYPGFIDAYTEFAPELLQARTGAPYWNSRVTPELKASRLYRSDNDANTKARAQGIVAKLVAPSAGIIKGTSALVSTGTDELRSILREEVAQQVVLEPARSGGGSGGRRDVPEAERYPTSPMGAFTLVRQAFYDAQWYGSAWKSVEANSKLPRPERNDALATLAAEFNAKTPFMILADDELYALRADKIGREFNLPVIIRGSGQEFRLLTEIAATKRPIVLPLTFPKAPSVATPEQAANISLMDLMAWDLAPENPARLDKAGVEIAFTSAGITGQDTFLGQLRKAVARGLSPDAALRALTITPAKLFGVESQLGSLAEGKSASFMIADGPLFETGTKVLDTWVSGDRFEVTPSPPLNPRGKWQIAFGPKNLTIALAGEHPQMTGEVSSPGGASTTSAPTSTSAPSTQPRGRRSANANTLNDLSLTDSRLSFTVRSEAFSNIPGAASISMTIVGNKAFGSALLPDGSRIELTATKLPAEIGSATSKSSIQPSTAPATKPSTKPALYEPNYPLGDYGQTGHPPQQSILFSNATVWTSDERGKIENGSVYIHQGKIASVFGSNARPKLMEGTLVVDCTGKHITAGLIDSHSHFATDGGINESGQTITAEVRIGDFIDPTDIAIYRQLAGGLTSSNILHGSANTIGGQNQVVKLRWGANPDQFKFEDAPAGIKFALGENPKQSNWGDNNTTRYPQTRMGVEQIVRDEFKAAQDYKAAWKKYETDKTGLPPRRDLELDAVVEILDNKRWIHCHSYRQDEILDLIRTTKDFGVTIGSLQHILEGYKVADEIARAGIHAAGFTDWWAYKFEVIDAIPYSPAIMYKQGVICSLNSDDAELATRLYHEAAKAVKYGGVPELDAWNMVTINPAKALRIDSRVGSLTPGKDADLVIWSESPMSSTTVPQQTWIDGRCYFSLEKDKALREENQKRRAALIQKILVSDEPSAGPNDPTPTRPSYWDRTDEFCIDCINVQRR